MLCEDISRTHTVRCNGFLSSPEKSDYNNFDLIRFDSIRFILNLCYVQRAKASQPLLKLLGAIKQTCQQNIRIIDSIRATQGNTIILKRS